MTSVLPCVGSHAIYDTLIDGDAEEVRYARRAALELCAACPQQRICFERNRDQDWVRTMVQGHRRKPAQTKPVVVDKPTTVGERNAVAMAEYNAARLAELQELIAAGRTLPAILGTLGLKRDSLRVWCRRNGHMDIWQHITRRNDNASVIAAVAELRAGDYADATIEQIAGRLGMTKKALEQHLARARRKGAVAA